ncbi:hypothetical protein DE146DRAFT_750926 [Phaeosphaeria sp. MPI-PUGE-AT-0046c]|nr:hypothetical protein DE146DRAFT_750926 [Phaeosphaeria sp. MPI-PUGE-AT-0046c]
MTEPQATKPPRVKTIDPSGDVRFNIGPAGQPSAKLLVNSRVLSFASPVFAARFNGCFAEGQGLFSANPREISLPEDELCSMEILCNTAHMRAAELPTKMEHTPLANFALLCEKYRSEDNFRTFCRVWIIDLLKDTKHNEFRKLLFVAYLLDLPHEFTEASKASHTRPCQNQLLNCRT